ncbi:putative RNA polymerase II-associated factor 1-like protein [Hypsibius exemplaris]|uniref:RNA polymerase II-associated factor 1 homolog n=1 Tax=Hypsibius exemplaris TaxID=2072580 RepID=A0A1W0WY19_HYPEX|nr:putative RNA polymerase II-associated factor 1-like protein [Hypsibius exemplaris]
MAPPGVPGQRSGRVVLSNAGAGERDDFLCKVKYLNRLPDLPADTKFLVYNVDMTPYVKYSHTSLEKEYKRDINCDSDMGMKLNLLTQQISTVDPTDREGRAIDEMLCADEPVTDLTPVKGPQRVDHGRHVAWLRKSQYILNDFGMNRGADMSTEKSLKRPASNIVDFPLKTQARRVESIMDTFETINKPKRHPNKPDLTVVEETPVFPDFDLVKYPVVIVNFDNDPAPPPVRNYMPDEVMASSMLRGMMDENGNQMVAYFVPTEGTMQKLVETRGNVDDNEEYIYKLHREYSLPDDRTRATTSKNDDSSVFAFNLRDGSLFYTELETKVKLARRPRGARKTKSRLVVRFVSEVPAEVVPEAEAESPAADEEEEPATKTPPPPADSDGAESSAEEILSNGVPTDDEDGKVEGEVKPKEERIRPEDNDIDEESAKSTSSGSDDSDSDNEPVSKKKAATKDSSDSDSD